MSKLKKIKEKMDLSAGRITEHKEKYLKTKNTEHLLKAIFYQNRHIMLQNMLNKINNE